jgi:hypothetical protein
MGKSWGETNLCVYTTKTHLKPSGKILGENDIVLLYEKTFGKEKLIY